MTAYSYPTDQHRLVKILGLDRYQYEANSLLNSLMTDQEDWDRDFNLDTVAETLAEMTAYEALNASYKTSLESQGLRSVGVGGEYSVSYANTAQETYQGRLGASLERIRKLLDPEDQLRRIRGGRARLLVS